MQTRARIIVKGEVQRVGYRDAVEKLNRDVTAIKVKLKAG